MGRARKARDEVSSLDTATLAQLQERFPREWEEVGQRLVAATESGRPEALAAFVTDAARAAAPWRTRLRKGASGERLLAEARPHLVAERMARLAAQAALEAAAAHAATGQAEGTLRFGRLSGQIVQRLLFTRGLVRKPVSMTAFRWLWPLVRQRRILMPLVQPKGIYCFYSRELVAALADEIGERSCLEIAAGDGTLARFLGWAGVDVRATDDQSWTQAITYPAEVERLDAVAALERHRPAAVVCSFPPPKNDFERQVFRTPSVQLYAVITSAHRFAAGDWEAYEKQTAFELTRDERLARLVLPPEIDPAVLIFRRR